MPIIVFLWLGLLIASIALEAATRTLVAIWFMPGEIIGLLLALCGVPEWIQILQFVVLSAVLLILTRRIAKRLLHGKPEATNADRIVGAEGIVTERVSFRDGTGQIKVLGQVWSVKADVPEQTLEAGTSVRVLRIEGVRAVIVPVSQENAD